MFMPQIDTYIPGLYCCCLFKPCRYMVEIGLTGNDVDEPVLDAKDVWMFSNDTIGCHIMWDTLKGEYDIYAT